MNKKVYMENEINLYWYKHEKGHGNFGDELNWYIVEKLSKCKVNRIDILHIPKNRLVALRVILASFLKRGRSIRKEYFLPFTNKKTIVAIGSVISWYNAPNIIVWGAGLIRIDQHIQKAEFRAVRGQYTLDKIKQLGYKCKQTSLGDPALLLPLIYKPSPVKKRKIGIIPHYIHFEDLIKQVKNDEDFIVIDLVGPIETILDLIQSCEMTISTSLHGVVVSHAYAVPSLWVDIQEVSEKKLTGDNIKFYDYFSSISIPEYDAVSISVHDVVMEDLVGLHRQKLLPGRDIRELQSNLIATAPFPVVASLS